ncbi:spore cortex biosynthesis protein YabQ [Peribacillus sp. NPDC097295]|uniref:spore cortex biosynthesis protein YabQ n=1 Tax=Peribacillus sp. NPDC097295 TaxID=3364402 RepID=UPI00380F6FE9
MTLTIQFYTLLSMIGMGSLFGAALDTYNHFLKRAERSKWIVFLHDFLFWVIQGLIIFYVLFLVNEGELRLYLFLALLCGFSAYQALLKGLYLQLLAFVILVVIKLFKFLTDLVRLLLFEPIKWIIMSMFAFILGIGKVIGSLLKGIGKVVLFILNIFWKPLSWIFLKMWNLLPDFVTKNGETFYNKGKGILLKMKNSISETVHRWRKRKK